MPRPDNGSIFTVNTERRLRSLAVWLKDREFNNVYPYLEDKSGNRMVGLNMKASNKRSDPRGVIVILNLDLLPCVIEMANAAKQERRGQ